jgi:hypothetical protein
VIKELVDEVVKNGFTLLYWSGCILVGVAVIAVGLIVYAAIKERKGE